MLQKGACPLNIWIIHIQKKVWKDFEIENLGEYLDLYVQSGILLLADVFEILRNTCLRIYGFDPAHFSTVFLAWQVALKETKVQLDLVNGINMFLMLGKRYQRRNMSLYLSICKS